MGFGGAFTDLEFTVAVSSLMGFAVVSKSRDVEEENVVGFLLAGGGDGSSSLLVIITIMSLPFRLDGIWDEGANERMRGGKKKRGGCYPDCVF